MSDTELKNAQRIPVLKQDQDILSPEGVEERVKKHMSFTITLTQGGMYRVYCGNNDGGPPMRSLPEANKVLVGVMAMFAMLEHDPEKALGIVMDGMRGKKE